MSRHSTTAMHPQYNIQVRSGSLISPGEPLARGFFVAPSKEKKIYKIKLQINVELIDIIMQKSV